MRRPTQAGCDWNSDVLDRFPISDRYLIGVSGGRDSVALLHWLLTRGYRKLVVCHLDHRLRSASPQDANFVVRLARKYELVTEMGSVDVQKLARREKISTETAGRSARYEFFAKVARRRRCHTIFLAHHADDLVETFLFNLLRGAGPAGLAGIRELAMHRIGRLELTVARPLLGIWRDDIDRYVRAHALRFREDKTNASLGPMRNRLRHRILPYIERQLGRNVRMSLWRAAAIAAEEEAWLADAVDEEMCEAAELPVATLRVQPIALQRRTIRAWLHAQQIADIDFATIERIRALIAEDEIVAKTNLAGGLHVRRRAKKLFIEPMRPSHRAKA